MHFMSHTYDLFLCYICSFTQHLAVTYSFFSRQASSEIRTSQTVVNTSHTPETGFRCAAAATEAAETTLAANIVVTMHV